jgi:SHS2 domain-containing protein
MTARALLRPSHAFEEHAGALRMSLAAPTLEDLFAEAARGLAELLAGTPFLPPAAGSHEPVVLRSFDRDALLVDWLNELLFRYETRRRLFVEFRFTHLSDRELSAFTRSAHTGEFRAMIKAATLEGLAITENDSGGLSAIVGFDI